jgi:hypothetical protein
VLREELQCPRVRVRPGFSHKAVALIGVDVTVAGEVFEPAEPDELFCIRDRDDGITLAVQDEQRRHSLELVEERVWQAAKPIGDSAHRRSLRSGGQRDRSTQRIAHQVDLLIAVALAHVRNQVADRRCPGGVILVADRPAARGALIVQQQRPVDMAREEGSLVTIAFDAGTTRAMQQDEDGIR